MSDYYQYEETRELVDLVKDAAEFVRSGGEAAFDDFRVAGSRWRQKDTYIFVLDPKGGMLLHPDPALEGKNEMDLKDINGKPIIRGLIDAAMSLRDKPEGWYHYQWTVPGGLLPPWKSSYVRRVTAPSGNHYVVGSGIYNDRMERAFVEHAGRDAGLRDADPVPQEALLRVLAGGNPGQPQGRAALSKRIVPHHV